MRFWPKDRTRCCVMVLTLLECYQRDLVFESHVGHPKPLAWDKVRWHNDSLIISINNTCRRLSLDLLVWRSCSGIFEVWHRALSNGNNNTWDYRDSNLGFCIVVLWFNSNFVTPLMAHVSVWSYIKPQNQLWQHSV